MADQEDRTQAATPRRLQKARDEGNVALSRELAPLAGLAAGAMTLAMTAPAAVHGLVPLLTVFLGRMHDRDMSDFGASALREAALAALGLAAPVVLAVLGASVAAVLLQSGFLFNPGALRPQLKRLNPAAGLKRLFGTEGLVEAAKSVVKLAVVAAIAWRVLAGDVPMLEAASFWEPALLADRMLRQILKLLLVLLAAQAVLVALDVVWVRFRHARSMRMSREDIRDEHKETDGDPRMKERLRRIRQTRARKRMLAAVPKAAVVVTNPTHYAVALAYDRGANAAPRVVAKGVDSMAARIRELAEHSRVPLVANPPLARALYRVELDTDIPAEHYQAVAEIIAYVWRLRGRARAAG